MYFKEVGKVAGLRKKIATSALNVNKTSVSQVSIAHTRWERAVLKELEGSFAFVFKSRHYPNEVVTARRGSPLLVGVKN